MSNKIKVEVEVELPAPRAGYEWVRLDDAEAEYAGLRDFVVRWQLRPGTRPAEVITLSLPREDVEEAVGDIRVLLQQGSALKPVWERIETAMQRALEAARVKREE